LNRAGATGQAAARLKDVCQIIADALGCATADAPQALATWGKAAGLMPLLDLGLDPALHDQIADAALISSSMKGNPVALTKADALMLLHQA
jgi:hypothetical protein